MPTPHFQTFRVSPDTLRLFDAVNWRSAGRGVSGLDRPRNDDGTVDLELSDEVVEILKARLRPGDTMEDVIRRVLWRARPLSANQP